MDRNKQINILRLILSSQDFYDFYTLGDFDAWIRGEPNNAEYERKVNDYLNKILDKIIIEK